MTDPVEVVYDDGTIGELAVPSQEDLDARDEWIAGQLTKLKETYGEFDLREEN